MIERVIFRLERFVSSDHDFKFYTGFPDYATFKAFFDYLSPECNHLNYHRLSTAAVLRRSKKAWQTMSIIPRRRGFYGTFQIALWFSWAGFSTQIWSVTIKHFKNMDNMDHIFVPSPEVSAHLAK